jgi:hypothetical protein
MTVFVLFFVKDFAAHSDAAHSDAAHSDAAHSDAAHSEQLRILLPEAPAHAHALFGFAYRH